MENVRTDSEIDEMLDHCYKGLEQGSQYPSMSYEEGVQAAIEWLLGNVDEKPFE